jgi:hypothetical protein
MGDLPACTSRHVTLTYIIIAHVFFDMAKYAFASLFEYLIRIRALHTGACVHNTGTRSKTLHESLQIDLQQMHGATHTSTSRVSVSSYIMNAEGLNL